MPKDKKALLAVAAVLLIAVIGVVMLLSTSALKTRH